MSLERWCITQYVSGIVLNVPYMWYDGIRRVKCHTDRAREEINWRSSRARVFSSDRRIAEIRLIANSQVSIRKSIGFYLIRNWDKSLSLFSRSNPSFVTRKISISKSIWSFDTTRQTFVRIHPTYQISLSFRRLLLLAKLLITFRLEILQSFPIDRGRSSIIFIIEPLDWDRSIL